MPNPNKDKSTVIVVSDLHAGSIFGMLPPKFLTFTKAAIEQNVGQLYLWDCWLDFCRRVKEFKRSATAIIINGDVVDGDQYRNKGSELTLVSPSDQADAAIACLKVLRDAAPNAKFFFTQGTPYHVGHWNQAEEYVASELGAERYESLGTGDRCREVLWLDVDGVIFEAAHHITVNQGFYRLTAIDREGQWSAISAKDASKGVPKSDILIRSHVHYFSYGEHASKQMLTTPAWQLQTRYMRKNSVHRMHPDIGGLIISVDAAAKERGESPCHVRKEMYRLPPVAVTKL